MAEEGAQHDHLPLIKYPSSGNEVILQRGSSVVVYDHASRRLRLLSTGDVEPAAACPTCHRPYDDVDDIDEDTQWMSPDYFQLLNRSSENSLPSSRSPSPQRLLRAETSALPQHLEPDAASAEAGRVDNREARDTAQSTHHPSISRDAFSPGYFQQHFVEVRELGRGGSGVVLQVKHVLQGHDVGDLACKRIPIGDDLPWLTKVLTEVKLLQRLRHPNLVAYMHVWLDHFRPSSFAPSIPHAFILQQYCNGGDLQQYIFKSYEGPNGEAFDHESLSRSIVAATSPETPSSLRRMPFDLVRVIFKDITSGLKYLHRKGFVHRDLKPSNCLLHWTEERLTVLVSDFGETTEENAVRKSSGATGTVSYCAPEVLKRDAETGNFGNFTQKSDIFSLGLIVHLMCFGKLPFANADPLHEENENYDLLREEIASWEGMSNEPGSRPDLSDRMREDMSRLLSLNPDERPSSEDILRALKAHPAIYDSLARSANGDLKRFHGF